MPRNQRMYELGIEEAKRIGLVCRVITDGSYTICLPNGRNDLIGIAKRNPIDQPDPERGATIATRRTLIKLGKFIEKQNNTVAYNNLLTGYRIV